MMVVLEAETEKGQNRKMGQRTCYGNYKLEREVIGGFSSDSTDPLNLILQNAWPLKHHWWFLEAGLKKCLA